MFSRRMGEIEGSSFINFVLRDQFPFCVMNLQCYGIFFSKMMSLHWYVRIQRTQCISRRIFRLWKSSHVTHVKMVFTVEDKAVIKNDFIEKNWSAYKIVKEHPTKNWNKSSVQYLLNKFKERGTMDRKPGSGRPISVTTEENENLVEQLICSQEESPGTHKSPREIEKITGIKRTLIRRMVKRNGWKQYKRIKTPRMSEGTKQNEKSWCLKERFSHKRSIEKIVEKDFTLDVSINHQNSRVYSKAGKKVDIAAERLFHKKNRQSIEVMVFAYIS